MDRWTELGKAKKQGSWEGGKAGEVKGELDGMEKGREKECDVGNWEGDGGGE